MPLHDGSHVQRGQLAYLPRDYLPQESLFERPLGGRSPYLLARISTSKLFLVLDFGLACIQCIHFSIRTPGASLAHDHLLLRYTESLSMVGFVLEAISALYILGGRLCFCKMFEDSWCPSGAERIARASFLDFTGCRPLKQGSESPQVLRPSCPRQHPHRHLQAAAKLKRSFKPRARVHRQPPGC